MSIAGDSGKIPRILPPNRTDACRAGLMVIFDHSKASVLFHVCGILKDEKIEMFQKYYHIDFPYFDNY